MTWLHHFDRLVKAMVQGEPHKAEKRSNEQQKANTNAKRKADKDD